MIKLSKMYKSIKEQQSQYEKAYKFFIGPNGIGTLAYLDTHHAVGAIEVATRYGFTINGELIDAFKSAIETHFWDGIEPEWQSPESEKFWRNLSASNYQELDKWDGRLTE